VSSKDNSQRREKPSRYKSTGLYAALQALNLAFCWGWFAALGLLAILGYDLDQIGFWLLGGAACAGFYGLRPNVERAIDAHWAGDGATAASREKATLLRPIKRRIDMAFSIVVLALLLAVLILWVLQMIQGPSSISG
jgi:hypothetical protein